MRDFWLFDDRAVGVFHYDGEGPRHGTARRPEEAAAARYIQDAAIACARPAEDVVRRVRSSM